jgi:hypothetical protein
VEGAQLGADAGEFLPESIDRRRQVSCSVANAEVAETLIEREDDELQAVMAVP